MAEKGKEAARAQFIWDNLPAPASLWWQPGADWFVGGLDALRKKLGGGEGGL